MAVPSSSFDPNNAAKGSNGNSNVAGTAGNMDPYTISQELAFYNIPRALAFGDHIPVNGEPKKFRNILDVMNDYAGWNNNQLAAMQTALEHAGYLRLSRTHPLIPGSDADGRTMAAYRNLVIDAARRGVSVQDQLNFALNNQADRSGGMNQGFTAKIENPTTLTGYATQAASDMNISLSQDDINNVIKAYQDQQVQAQTALNTGANTANVINDPKAFIEGWMRQNRPGEVQVGQTGNELDILNQAIKGNT